MLLLHDSQRQRTVGQLLAGRGAPIGVRAALVPPDLVGVAAEVPPVIEHGPGRVGAARRVYEHVRVVRRPGRVAGRVVLRRARRPRRAAGVERRRRRAAVDLADAQARVRAADGPAGPG